MTVDITMVFWSFFKNPSTFLGYKNLFALESWFFLPSVPHNNSKKPIQLRVDTIFCFNFIQENVFFIIALHYLVQCNPCKAHGRDRLLNGLHIAA